MKRLPENATDTEVIQAISEWVGLLAQERYQDAFDFLYHPWLPTRPQNEMDTDTIRGLVTGEADIYPPGTRAKVTFVEAAPAKESHQEWPYQDVQRYEVSDDGTWDEILVRFGGTPSGAIAVGSVHFFVAFGWGLE